MRRWSYLALVLIFLGDTAITWADEYSILAESTVMGRNYGVPAKVSAAGFSVLAESAFFFKNLELFDIGDILGETVTGYRLPLRLGYHPHPEFTVEMGLLLGRDYGDLVALNHVSPLVRLTYEPTPGLYVIAGMVYPTHWIHDAILDDIIRLRGIPEEGFQLRADQPWLKSDTWLNWRIREGDVRAEEFEIGSSNQWRLWADSLRLEAQVLWAHAGGQVSTSTRVEQNLAGMLGGSWGAKQPLGWRACEEIRLGWSYLYSNNESEVLPVTHNYGRSFHFSADIRVLPHFLFHGFGGVFHGDGFNARRGDPLYQLERYSQLGTNLVFDLVDESLQIEAGFVDQWTGEANNLTYQLSLIWHENSLNIR